MKKELPPKPNFKFSGDEESLKPETLLFWLDRADKFQGAMGAVSDKVTERAYTFLNVAIVLAHLYGGGVFGSILVDGADKRWPIASCAGFLPLLVAFWFLWRALKPFNFFYIGDMPRYMWEPGYILRDKDKEKVFNILHQLELSQSKIDDNMATILYRRRQVYLAAIFMCLATAVTVFTLALLAFC